jgi:hypothetical protein
MKAAGLVFLTLGYLAWTVGGAHAAQSVAAAQQAAPPSGANTVGNHSREADHAAPAADGPHVGKLSDDQQNHRRISGNKLPTSNSKPSKSSRPTGRPNTRERSVAEDSKNSHRPGSGKSAGATQNGLARNGTVNHASSNRAPNAARPIAPSLGNVRHSGPNPPIIGGVGSSNTRNTAALGGTHMNRKRTGN